MEIGQVDPCASSISSNASSLVDADYGAVALHTFMWSSVSSAGFLFAVLFAYVILKFIIKSEGNRNPGEFGKFLILVELIDAVPEASLIAALTAKGNMNISFGLSLTFLNIANTLASSMDFLATAENYKIHRFVYTALYFSVGMLAYTIPVQVYATYVLHYQEGERDLFHGLVMLIATLTGAGLIVMLMNFEKAILGEEKAKLEEQYAILERIVDDLARDIQGKMGEQLKNKNIEKLMDAVEDDKALLDEATGRFVTREQMLTVAKMFMKLLQRKDTAHVTAGLLQVIGMEELLAVNDYETFPELREGVINASLEKRALKLFGYMFGISSFAAGLSVLFSLMVVRLESNASVLAYVDSFFEGFSGGAFLATIAGTMMFRLHSDANAAALNTFRLKVWGLIVFNCGLLFATILAVVG